MNTLTTIANLSAIATLLFFLFGNFARRSKWEAGQFSFMVLQVLAYCVQCGALFFLG